jgi:hypothetical protein
MCIYKSIYTTSITDVTTRLAKFVTKLFDFLTLKSLDLTSLLPDATDRVPTHIIVACETFCKHYFYTIQRVWNSSIVPNSFTYAVFCSLTNMWNNEAILFCTSGEIHAKTWALEIKTFSFVGKNFKGSKYMADTRIILLRKYSYHNTKHAEL